MHILGDDQKKRLKIGRVGTRDEAQTRILAIVLLLAGPDLADRPFITKGVPCSSSDSALQMAQSYFAGLSRSIRLLAAATHKFFGA